MLLVSVRSSAEAEHALEGGAEIIDIKEPSNGPLGRAGLEAEEAVVARLAREGCAVLITAALGELSSQDDPYRCRLPLGVSLFKLGLAGMGPDSSWEKSLDAWVERLRDSGAALVAAGYADHGLAASPAPAAVLRFAASRRLPYFLLDTFSKSGGSLFSCFPEDGILELISTARAGGVRIALAGSLRGEDIGRAARLGPDVIAVRGAACSLGRRDLGIDAERVREIAAEVNPGRRRPSSRAFDAQGPQGPRRE